MAKLHDELKEWVRIHGRIVPDEGGQDQDKVALFRLYLVVDRSEVPEKFRGMLASRPATGKPRPGKDSKAR